jgi:hypothetical protein
MFSEGSIRALNLIDLVPRKVVRRDRILAFAFCDGSRMNIFISYLTGIDLTAFHAINGLCGQSIFSRPSRRPTGKRSAEGPGLH